jgi:hypothetical protein
MPCLVRSDAHDIQRTVSAMSEVDAASIFPDEPASATPRRPRESPRVTFFQSEATSSRPRP